MLDTHNATDFTAKPFEHCDLPNTKLNPNLLNFVRNFQILLKNFFKKSVGWVGQLSCSCFCSHSLYFMDYFVQNLKFAMWLLQADPTAHASVHVGVNHHRPHRRNVFDIRGHCLHLQFWHHHQTLLLAVVILMDRSALSWTPTYVITLTYATRLIALLCVNLRTMWACWARVRVRQGVYVFGGKETQILQVWNKLKFIIVFKN